MFPGEFAREGTGAVRMKGRLYGPSFRAAPSDCLTGTTSQRKDRCAMTGLNGSMRLAALLTSLVVLVFGCATQGKNVRRASVVDYLYPKKAEPVEVPGPTVMSLPIRVAVAFVPETQSSMQASPMAWTAPDAGVFTEKQKLGLMEDISRNFRQYSFVKSVEAVPTQYLMPGGGFDNLDQIRTMFGTDVIALLSYDQVQFTAEGVLSVTYWTLLGAYVIPGERNDTVTMIDAAVYHIPNRKLLFRAPGVSHKKGTATPVNLNEQLRLDSEAGFQEAAADLVPNLQAQLSAFQEKVKEQPEEYKVEHKPGYTGQGRVDVLTVLLVLLMAATSLHRRSNRTG
jgi:rhombotail lipoprotein